MAQRARAHVCRHVCRRVHRHMGAPHLRARTGFKRVFPAHFMAASKLRSARRYCWYAASFSPALSSRVASYHGPEVVGPYAVRRAIWVGCRAGLKSAWAAGSMNHRLEDHSVVMREPWVGGLRCTLTISIAWLVKSTMPPLFWRGRRAPMRRGTRTLCGLADIGDIREHAVRVRHAVRTCRTQRSRHKERWRRTSFHSIEAHFDLMPRRPEE